MTLEEAQKKLERWEAYRQEMLNMEKKQAAFAANFLELGAYTDAARCANMAEGMRFVVGRMPPIQIALSEVPQLPQRQDSTNSQLQDLITIANKFGLYDAADAVRAMLAQR